MAYTKQSWENAPSTESPISAQALNHMEDGIEAAHTGLDGKVEDADPRLSDARTPTAHSHNGSDINAGTVPYARLPVGSAANTVAAGNDSRLSDARTPTAHNHAAVDINSGTLNIARIPTGTTSSTVCIGNDSRLSNTRTPTDNTVSTAKIQDGAVTTAKIGDSQVTSAKIGDSQVVTAKIGDGQVTAAKLASAVLANRPEVHVGTTPPGNTSMLWVDTN